MQCIMFAHLFTSSQPVLVTPLNDDGFMRSYPSKIMTLEQEVTILEICRSR
jgi:hypothetical protein